MIRVTLTFALFLAGLWWVGAPALPARAATVSVCPTTQTDLVNAISTAGAGGTVQINCDTTITLSSTIVLDSDVTLDGTGFTATISGNNAVRAFIIGAGANVALNHLSIINSGSSGTQDGGGILNGGSLSVAHSTFSGNSAYNIGGAIYNLATLSVSHSTFIGNDADFGGGIGSFGGTLSVTDSMFDHNSAVYGGGIVLDIDGVATVTGSIFNDNAALLPGFASYGGGIWNLGLLSVSDSVFSGNASDIGGGVYNTGVLTITDTTFRENSVASAGGGIATRSFAPDRGTVTMTGSGLSGNTAGSNGYGGGIFIFTGATLTIANTTLQESGIGGNCGTVQGSALPVNLGGNQDDDNTCGFATADSTAPDITYVVDPAMPSGANGWYTGDVTLTWTVAEDETTDTLVATGCVDQAINVDQAEMVYSCAATSDGGSATPVEVAIKRDATAPAVNVTGVSEGAEYNLGSVPAAGCATTDETSGVAIQATLSTTGGPAGAITASCSGALDNAGNPGSASVNYTVTAPVDVTAPVISYELDPATPSGGNGWYRGDVGIVWTVTDAESAVTIDSGCANQVINADTPPAGLILSCSANSDGGATSETATLFRDATAPDVSVTGVSDGATYILGSVPDAGCATADATSGVATDATLSTSGGPLGAITSSCVGALDNAGNVGSASATYSVVYSWSGFTGPVDDLPTVNAVKAGRAVPVTFSLAGDQGLAAIASVTSVTIGCDAATPVNAVESTESAGNSKLQYDPLTDQYTYVWKTNKSWAGTCRQLQVTLADGTMHRANFTFQK